MQISRSTVTALLTSMGFVTCVSWDDTKLLKKIARLPSIEDEDIQGLGKEDKKTLKTILDALEAGEEVGIGGDDAPAKAKKASTPSTKGKGKKAPVVEADEDDEDEDEDEDDEDEVDEDEVDEDEVDEDEVDEPAPAPAKGKGKGKGKKAPVAEDDEPAPAPAKGKGKGKKAPVAEDDEPAPAKAKGKPITKAGGVGVIGSIVEFLSTATEKKPMSKEVLADKLAARFPDRERDSMKATINVQVPNRLAHDKNLDVQKNDKGFWIANT